MGRPYGYGSLALATLPDDHDWYSFVYWVLEGTIYAEENDIDEILNNEMPEVFVFGRAFKRMLRDPILAVGNYGQIYSRNMEAIIPRSGRNQLNDMSNPGPQQLPPEGFGTIVHRE